MFYKKNFYVKHLFQLNQSQNNYGRLSLFRKAWQKKKKCLRFITLMSWNDKNEERKKELKQSYFHLFPR